MDGFIYSIMIYKFIKQITQVNKDKSKEVIEQLLAKLDLVSNDKALIVLSNFNAHTQPNEVVIIKGDKIDGN